MTVMAEIEPTRWQDEPDTTPMEITLQHEGGSKRMALTLGNCAVALFRHRPELDYLAVQHEHEGETSWTFIFDKHPLIYWMGNIALTSEAQRSLHLANRSHGSFYNRYGWNPDVIIEGYPHENEINAYVDYQLADIKLGGTEE